MNWLNLNIQTLDSENFIGSDPVDRSTWICLQRYCIGQENGGVIPNCKDWPDRKWQQLVRITKKEALHGCDLWSWDGDSLILWGYPSEKEDEVKTKRDRAKTNGAKGGRPKKTDVGLEKEPTLVNSAKAERNEKGIGKEGEGNCEVLTTSPLCTLPQAISYASSCFLTETEAEHWWHTRNANGWLKGTNGGHPIRISSWQSDMKQSVAWIKESAAKKPAPKRQLQFTDEP